MKIHSSETVGLFFPIDFLKFILEWHGHQHEQKKLIPFALVRTKAHMHHTARNIPKIATERKKGSENEVGKHSVTLHKVK